MYLIGDGVRVPQDKAESVKWSRKAAEQGLAAAQYRLWKLYAKGQGVPQDKAEAMKWLRKAAEQGNSDAKEWLEKNSKESEE